MSLAIMTYKKCTNWAVHGAKMKKSSKTMAVFGSAKEKFTNLSLTMVGIYEFGGI